MLKYAFLLFFIFTFLQSKAQQKDSILISSKSAKADTSKSKLKKFGHEIGLLFRDSTKLQNPRKALLRSAIIPGWGQARNHKWWKVPLVYGGFVGLGLVYEFNNRYYKEFLTESQFRTESKTPDEVSFYPQYKGIPASQIYSAKDFYRRNRDLTLYASIGFYGLQMLDAYIDARLATFDVGDDLSFKIKPSIYIPSYAASGFAAPIPMLTLKINL